MLKLMCELGFGISGAEVLEGLRLFVVFFLGWGVRTQAGVGEFKGDMDSDLGIN